MGRAGRVGLVSPLGLVFSVAAMVALLVAAQAASAQSGPPGEDGSQVPRFVVPLATSTGIAADGTWSAEEWAGALRRPLSDNVELYLLADSANLYVAFRFLQDVEADFVSEIYVAINDQEFLNLHSSGALGEGVNRFAPDLQRPVFTIGTSPGWESNVTRAGARVNAKEYRIAREKLPSGILKAAGGLAVVNQVMRETANFPEHYDFGSASGWVEVVLP